MGYLVFGSSGFNCRASLIPHDRHRAWVFKMESQSRARCKASGVPVSHIRGLCSVQEPGPRHHPHLSVLFEGPNSRLSKYVLTRRVESGSVLTCSVLMFKPQDTI